MDFGFLTLCTRKDYMKAIALSLSIKRLDSSYLTAAVSHPSTKKLVEPYFDYVIEEKVDIKGFAHKLFLDEYSPFKKTFFFDSDILVFKSIKSVLKDWTGSPYAARGWYVSDGFSAFGADRKHVLKRINKEKLVCIDGAGHAYFEKPECHTVFNTAREIMRNYDFYSNKCAFADEDVMNIAMTIHGITPKKGFGMHGSPWHAKNQIIQMNILNGTCGYIDLGTGKKVDPIWLHFARQVAPFAYAKQMYLLYRSKKVGPTLILWIQALKEFLEANFFNPLKTALRKFRNFKNET